MKKMLAFVLSVAMMFSVTLTAFATETEAEAPETTEWSSELLGTIRGFGGSTQNTRTCGMRSSRSSDLSLAESSKVRWRMSRPLLKSDSV